jgi:hypothetical protein
MRYANNTNRTMETSFKGMIYALQAGCSKGGNNQSQSGNQSQGVQYCGLINNNLGNHTCESLQAEYGCCAATILPSARFCEWTNYTNTNMSNLLNCTWTVQPCNGLGWAWDFCGINNGTKNNGTNNNSSSSSSSGSFSGSSSMSSSGIINSSTSSNTTGTGSSSSWTGMSSSWIGSNTSSPHTGHGGNITTGNGAVSGKAFSWTITIALVVTVAAHILS